VKVEVFHTTKQVAVQARLLPWYLSSPMHWIC